MTKTKRKAETAPAGFVDGTDLIDELLDEPGMDAAVANIERDVAEMNRIHAQGLAEIRKAAALTQTDLAKNMGIQQGAVSRIESRDDVLLSTLAEYAVAAGAVEARIVFHINGVDVELPLERYRVHHE
jgi:DNA-binding XRE family transcriptional regulator